MLNTERSSAEIANIIAEKRDRYAALNTERQKLAENVRTIQAETGRLIAEGKESPASAQKKVRDLTDQEWPLVAGMQAIEAELPGLEAELKAVTVREAVQDAKTAGEDAITAAEQFDALVSGVVLKTLAPATSALLQSFERARDIIARAHRLENGVSVRMHDDPLPSDIARRVAPTMRLILPIRGFLQELAALEAEEASDATRAALAVETSTEGMVRVAMPRSYHYQGKHYGPGASVLVPIGLQQACDLELLDPLTENASLDAAENSESVSADHAEAA